MRVLERIAEGEFSESQLRDIMRNASILENIAVVEACRDYLLKNHSVETVTESVAN